MLTARDERGAPVDWWFMYKLPRGIQPAGKQHRGRKKTQGNEYLYYDPATMRPLELSPYRLGEGPYGALYKTLQQLFSRPTKTMGWIFYNDEYPEDISPYQRKAKSYWLKGPTPKGAPKITASEAASLTKAMIKEGVLKKAKKGERQQQPTKDQLLRFRAAREKMIAEIEELEKQLIAAWRDHDSPWPPNVEPKLNSGTSRKSDRGHAPDHSTNGHNKGVLAFDLATDSAFWLSHSTPRIPALKTPPSERFFYPEYADQYAQTFICISLGSVEAACEIAAVMKTQHEPQVFGCRLPKAITDVPDEVKQKSAAAVKKWTAANPTWHLWDLAQGSVPDAPRHSKTGKLLDPKRKPADHSFQSRGVGGKPKTFRLLAKSAAWDDDFWIDLVGPTLEDVDGKPGVDLRVETWRRLTDTAILPRHDIAPPDADTPVYFGSHDFTSTFAGAKHAYHHEFFENNGMDVVDEITNIDLGALLDPSGLLTGEDNKGAPLTGYIWSYTKDHAKWAISEEQEDRGVRTIELRNGHVLANEEGTVSDWVCIADINRMSSQERRGGGAICFHEPLLWHGLNQIERISGRIGPKPKKTKAKKK